MNISIRIGSFAILAMLIITFLLPQEARSQVEGGTGITVDIWGAPRARQNFQLGQLNANLGQLNANLGDTRGSVFTVTNLNDSGPGSLRQAIIDANWNAGHDTVKFDLSGVFRANARSKDFVPTITVTEQLNIFDSLTIIGPGADLIRVSGDPASPGNRIFNISGLGGQPTVNLIGMTVSLGKLLESLGARNSGGGVYATNCILNLYQMTVENNHADLGGGVYHQGGTLNIAQSAITGNSAGSGGGVAVGRNSEAYITNSLISRKFTTTTGSGILSQGDSTLINSTVTENISPPTGSAIRSFYIDSDTAETDLLPGLYLVNATVSHNEGFGLETGGVTASLGNTIVARNNSSSGDDLAGSFFSYGTNLIGSVPNEIASFSVVFGDLVGTSTDPIDPNLGPLQNNGGSNETRALLGGSPAINMANNCVGIPLEPDGCMLFALTADQRLAADLPRLVEGRVDIGAFESHFTDQPASIDQCRNGGWKHFNNPRLFNNQGDCIQFVNTGS